MPKPKPLAIEAARQLMLQNPHWPSERVFRALKVDGHDLSRGTISGIRRELIKLGAELPSWAPGVEANIIKQIILDNYQNGFDAVMAKINEQQIETTPRKVVGFYRNLITAKKLPPSKLLGLPRKKRFGRKLV